MNMNDINIVNHIEEKIKEYQKNTGATKTWIAKQMGYNSIQAFDKAMKNNSNSLETYAKFSSFLHCNVNDLFSINQ